MGLFTVVNNIMEGVAGTFGARADSYIDIETVDSDTVLALKDGTLLTLIEIDGIKGVIDVDGLDTIVQHLSTALGVILGKPGTVIQFVFASDPEGAYRDLVRLQSGLVASAKRMELDVDDILAERTKVLRKWVVRERMFMAIWTTPHVLLSATRKEAAKNRAKRVGKTPPGRHSQNNMAPIVELRSAHMATVMATMGVFDSDAVGINAWVVPAREVLYQIRYMIDPLWTSDKWQGVLPGDPNSLRLKSLDPGETPIDTIFWPRVSAQVFPRGAEITDMRTVRIGDIYYRPLVMNLGPASPGIFRDFYLRAREADLPFRLSFRLESGGMNLVQTKRTFMQILGRMSSSNQMFLQAAEQLAQRYMNTSEATVKLRISAVTWAEDPAELKRRGAMLAQLLNGWGDAEWSETTGAPVAGVMATVPGATKGDLSPPAAWPISDALRLLPLTRPSMPWRDGAQLLRSPDGKLLPFQPGSTLQTAWVNLGFAPMGGGKSVFLNTTNLALCLAPGLKRLPRIAVIDIGWSSSGLISLLRGALPPSKRHYAVYEKLQMSEKYAINVFDTALGSRLPLPFQRTFIKNFLTLLSTPIGETKPYDGVGGVIDLVIDMVYESTSDLSAQKAFPKKYEQGVDRVVDKALNKLGLAAGIDGMTTWWNVVDMLFEKGDTHAASLAQRYAVPTLNDVIPLFRDPAVQSQFTVTLPTGENISQYMIRAITSAIREYRIIGQPTRFDLGEARVVVLNLEDVAPDGGETNPSANKQTGVFYLLSLYTLTKDFWLTTEILPFFPEKYRAYHTERITEVREDTKHLACDEFHRTRGFSAIADQIERVIREGRKWGVIVSLFSQMASDFNETLQNLMTCGFIFGAGLNTDDVAKAFKLSPIVQRILTYGIKKPGARGADLVGIFRTAKGMMTQHLTSTIGPMELWAFSTTKEDVNLRTRLYEQIGPVLARKRLARRFPGGSAATEIERRMAAMTDTNDLVLRDKMADDVIGGLAKELIDMPDDN